MPGPQELWIKYRPQTLDDVIGQEPAVRLLRSYLDSKSVPRALLFTGPSGTGKSTLAYILAREMGSTGLDFNVINCATVESPLDAIRDLQRQIRSSPVGNNTCRVWVCEEIQTFARATYAQQAMLLMLEDASKATRKSHLMLCTTDPEKLKAAIRNRCKKIELQNLTESALKNLLVGVAEKEGHELPDSVINKIISVAGGSAREALNQLDSALAVGDDEDAMLEVISGVKDDDMVWKLLKVLFYERPRWPNVAKVIKEITDDREAFRHRVLKMAATEMLKCGKNAARAYLIYDVFKHSWEHCQEAGLEGSCMEIWQTCGRK